MEYNLDDLYVLHAITEGTSFDYNLHVYVTRLLESLEKRGYINDSSYVLYLLVMFIKQDYRYEYGDTLFKFKNTDMCASDIAANLIEVMPLEDMPLYISYKFPDIRILAEWRLKIGK